jgi:hypothetical protein
MLPVAFATAYIIVARGPARKRAACYLDLLRLLILTVAFAILFYSYQPNITGMYV